MIAVAADAILLDVEGTTSSIDFVYQQMFPYVRRQLQSFVFSHADRAEVRQAMTAIAAEANVSLLPDAWEHEATRPVALTQICDAVTQLMDQDAKTTGLKQLQGLIWRDGFHNGELVAHVYPDLLPTLDQWRNAGLELRIYSSGSIAAQKLFFGHTVAGDLLHYFSGHYDTTVGGKRDAASYRAIAADWEMPTERIVFVSDVVEELAAARDAGMQSVLSVRPGNPPQPQANDWPTIESFAQLQVGR